MGGVNRDDAAALFERRRQAWLNEDVEDYLDCFAEDLVLETPASEPTHGRARYAALVRRSLAAVRPVAFDFHEIAVHGTTVLAEWTITLEVRADRRELSYRGMSICEIEDGRILWWREYYDPYWQRASGR